MRMSSGMPHRPDLRSEFVDDTVAVNSTCVEAVTGMALEDSVQLRPATIVDVAREAGVSKATVSLVLNGRDGALRISDATRTAVLTAAELLRYTPNHAARSLRNRRTGAVMLIVTRLTNPY